MEILSGLPIPALTRPEAVARNDAADAPGARGGDGAPGQQAKAAVAAARADGAELPANAKGFAASAIARGADPASVFAALSPPPPEPAAGPADGTGSAPDRPAVVRPNDTGSPLAETAPEPGLRAPDDAVRAFAPDRAAVPAAPASAANPASDPSPATVATTASFEAAAGYPVAQTMVEGALVAAEG